MLKQTEWLKPYSIKSQGLWPFRQHQIMFEGGPVMFSSPDHEMVSKVVAGLNGAYNLGRQSAQFAA